MQTEAITLRSRHLLAKALLATFIVVGLPLLIVVGAAALGLPEPRLVLAMLLGILISCMAAAVGTSLWLRRPESVEVGFGDLMMWRYVRRRRAERRIARGAETLGLDLSGTPAADLRIAPDHHLEVLHEVTAALEAKDPYTHGHSRRVERHSYRTAMCLELSAHEIEDLRLSAALHDVGKIRIPDRILRKPGSLTLEERDAIRAHPVVGAAMVQGSVPRPVAEAIRHHHECYDGAGYPSGLAGEQIPLFARIITVVDAYDAMTSARPYRAGCARKTAIEALRAGAGSQFDPHVVEAFINTLPSAVPIAGAFAVLALPAQGMRRIVAWSKTTTGGGLAGAVGAAGMAALVATTGVPVGPSAPLLPPAAAAPAALAPAPQQSPRMPLQDDEVLDGLYRVEVPPARVAGKVVRPVAGGEAGSSAAEAPAAVVGPAQPAPKQQPSQPGPAQPQPPKPAQPPAEDPGQPAHEPDPAPAQPNGGGDERDCVETGRGRGKAVGHEKGKGRGHERHCH